MDAEQVERSLVRAERALANGQGLRGTGFWPAVGAARRDPVLADAFALRITAIDRQAFEQAVRLRTTPSRGLVLLVVGTLAGVALVGGAAAVDGTAQTAALLLAWGVLTLSTHSLAHWVVGRMLGIEFTHVFVGHLPEPFPGVKIDYATYLPTRPRARALMHASGALVSKVVPFAVLAAGAAMDAPDLALQILLVAGAVSIALDVAGWFTSGDWKKVRRELAAARTWS